jgi:ubiquinone/menaquinone biosynthesis C-methylase UbiE
MALRSLQPCIGPTAAPNVDRRTFREMEFVGWNKVAPDYDEFAGSFTRNAAAPLLEAIAARPKMRIMDLACGPGYVAAQAASLGASPVGVDFAPSMISIAQRLNPQIEFRVGDAESLAFQDKTFGGVVCAFGLLHFSNPDHAIHEVHRVLRPGGRFAFTNWLGTEHSEFFDLVMNAIRQHGDTDVDLPASPPMFRFSDRDECISTLERAEFQSVRHRRLDFLWTPESPAKVLEYCYKSSARMPILLAPQTDAARKAIHESILRGAARFIRNGKLEIRWVALMVSCSKPR